MKDNVVENHKQNSNGIMKLTFVTVCLVCLYLNQMSCSTQQTTRELKVGAVRSSPVGIKGASSIRAEQDDAPPSPPMVIRIKSNDIDYPKALDNSLCSPCQFSVGAFIGYDGFADEVKVQRQDIESSYRPRGRAATQTEIDEIEVALINIAKKMKYETGGKAWRVITVNFEKP